MTGRRKAKYGKTKITGSCAQTKNAEMSAKLQLTFVFTIFRSDVIKYTYVRAAAGFSNPGGLAVMWWA